MKLLIIHSAVSFKPIVKENINIKQKLEGNHKEVD